MTGVPSQKHEADFLWAQEILAGSEEAWHRFVLRYSGLIQAVLRRYLFDTDSVRTVYVDVLEKLYRGKLASYRGQAGLSTWLVLVSRNAALDHLRHRLGRRELPTGLRKLGKEDQEIYRLYYIEGLSFSAVCHWAGREKGEPLKAGNLAAALRRIEARLSDRVLRRIAYDLHAPSVGASSGRLLEFLEQYRRDGATRSWESTPEYDLMEKQARALATQLREHLGKLPAEERDILSLRFEQGLTAAQIAIERNLAGPRKAYTIIDRAIRRLRRLMGFSSPRGERPSSAGED